MNDWGFYGRRDDLDDAAAADRRPALVLLANQRPPADREDDVGSTGVGGRGPVGRAAGGDPGLRRGRRAVGGGRTQLEAYHIPPDRVPPAAVARPSSPARSRRSRGPAILVLLDEFQYLARKPHGEFQLAFAVCRRPADGRRGGRARRADRVGIAARGDGRPAGGPGGPVVRPADGQDRAVPPRRGEPVGTAPGGRPARPGLAACSSGRCSRASRSTTGTPTSWGVLKTGGPHGPAGRPVLSERLPPADGGGHCGSSAN